MLGRGAGSAKERDGRVKNERDPFEPVGQEALGANTWGDAVVRAYMVNSLKFSMVSGFGFEVRIVRREDVCELLCLFSPRRTD